MKYLLAAAAAVVSAAAPAAVLTLESVTTNGPSNFTFRYQATLDKNEGLRNGDRFVIFDFDGYIDDSVASASSLLVASSELVSATAVPNPSYTDDPTKTNLVFTYTGSGFRTTGGPTLAFDIEGLSGRSIFGGRSADGFYARTTKNDPNSGTDWAMMLGGFGLLGSAMRRRRGAVRHALA